MTRQSTIEKFLAEKSAFILNALEKYKKAVPKVNTVYFSEEEVKKLIVKLCENIYPYFENLGIKYPEIRFRKMVSQWGNCYHKRNILTFNTNLMYAPIECIEYVVAHEFVHFLQPNHSQKFYTELAKIIFFERSGFISYANCGLPYYIGSEISDKEEAENFETYKTLRQEQEITDNDFYHYDTPLTVNHEIEALISGGFRNVQILGSWGATYTLKADK